MSYNPQNPNGNTTAANSSPVTLASDTNGPVKLYDGTNTANVIAPGTANSTGNALLVGNTSNNVSFTTTTAQAVASTDAGNYSWVSVYVSTQGTNSTITFQGSNDNTNWISVPLASINGTVGNYSLTSTSAGVGYHGALSMRYFRLNVTGITAGTTAGTVTFFTLARTSQLVGATIQAAATSTNSTLSSSTSTVTESSLQLYGSFAVVTVTGTSYSGSFIIQVSDSNGATYYNTPVYNASAGFWYQPGATITPTPNTSVLYYVPLPPNSTGTTVKVAATSWSSGTATVRIGSGFNASNPGSSLSQIIDAAGNSRGVNVTAGNAIQSDITSVAGTGVNTAASGTLLVGLADGSGNKLTTNSTTYSSKLALDNNLLGTLGTAFTTPGFVDIKGADGNVFVRQSTPANLQATVTQVSGNWNDNIAQFGGNNVVTGTGASGSGIPRVTVSNDSNVLATQSGNWTSRVVGNAGGILDTTTGSSVPANALYHGINVGGNLRGLTGVNPTGSVYAGQIDIASVSGTTPTTAGFIDVAVTPKTSGGLGTPYTGSIGATATSVKSSAGQIYSIYCFNNNTAVSYLQIFNTASGSVTLGTTAPVASFGIPPGGGFTKDIPSGWAFGTAITVAVTTTRSGSTGPTNTVDLNIWYD